MAERVRSVSEITQLADQLMDVVHDLLEIAGGAPSSPAERLFAANAFQPDTRRYYSNDEFVDLSKIEAKILDALLRNKGGLVTKAHLCEILDLDPVMQERNLKSYVYRLKAKLNRMNNPGIKIRPIHGAGYVLSEIRDGSITASA